MRYRKFSASHLFNGKRFLDSGDVLVTDEKGTVQSIISKGDAGEDVEHYDGIISPGFINTHCHLELSHMKGVIERSGGLVQFLSRVIKERFVSAELIFEAMVKAQEDMIASGTVAVADICNSSDSLPLKRDGKICWKNFIEVIGFSDKPENRFEYALKILSAFNDVQLPASLVPHAPYSVSPQLFSLLDQASGSVTTIHNQESIAEDNLYRKAEGDLFILYDNLKINPSFFQPSGKSSVQTYLPWLHRAEHIILVHNTYTSQEDIAFVKQQELYKGQQVFFAICLRANKYIESIYPPVNLLMDNGCKITIGTDSLASNDSLNMMDEIKSIIHAFPHLPQDEILRWATVNGAEAIRMEDKLGSFEPGKTPGIVLIDNNQGRNISPASASRRLL